MKNIPVCVWLLPESTERLVLAQFMCTTAPVVSASRQSNTWLVGRRARGEWRENGVTSLGQHWFVFRVQLTESVSSGVDLIGLAKSMQKAANSTHFPGEPPTFGQPSDTAVSHWAAAIAMRSVAPVTQTCSLHSVSLIHPPSKLQINGWNSSQTSDREGYATKIH